ncbi:SURF1 family protein [Dermabacteraceae bacterium P7074]
MLRIALRPKFLGILALMIVLASICALLANWQWSRAQRTLADAPARQVAEIPLENVLLPRAPVVNSAVGKSVFVEGEFAPEKQVLVPGRSIAGEKATLVVSGLITPAGDVLPVVRGWLPGEVSPSDVPAPPSGKRRVIGWLEASEAAVRGEIGPGRVGEIATPLLVNLWHAPMYSGYLAAAPAQGEGLRAMPAPEEKRGALNLQNLGYAAQWLLFGGFFLYIWWKMVRQTYLDEINFPRKASEG